MQPIIPNGIELYKVNELLAKFRIAILRGDTKREEQYRNEIMVLFYKIQASSVQKALGARDIDAQHS